MIAAYVRLIMIGARIEKMIMNPVFPNLISSPSILRMAIPPAVAIKIHIVPKIIKITNAESFIVFFLT